MKEKADTENEVACLPLPSRSQGCIAIFSEGSDISMCEFYAVPLEGKETSVESYWHSFLRIRLGGEVSTPPPLLPLPHTISQLVQGLI
jgi:hypothetical protein